MNAKEFPWILNFGHPPPISHTQSVPNIHFRSLNSYLVCQKFLKLQTCVVICKIIWCISDGYHINYMDGFHPALGAPRSEHIPICFCLDTQYLKLYNIWLYRIVSDRNYLVLSITKWNNLSWKLNVYSALFYYSTLLYKLGRHTVFTFHFCLGRINNVFPWHFLLSKTWICSHVALTNTILCKMYVPIDEDKILK